MPSTIEKPKEIRRSTEIKQTLGPKGRMFNIGLSKKKLKGVDMHPYMTMPSAEFLEEMKSGRGSQYLSNKKTIDLRAKKNEMVALR